MSAAARANMMVKRNAEKKAMKDAKAAFADRGDDGMITESYPDCVHEMSDDLRDIMTQQMLAFRDELEKAISSDDSEALLKLEDNFETLLYGGFVMHKGFYKLDPLKSQGENMAQTVIVAEESTHLQQDILPSPLDSIMGVVCFPFPIQFCKRITSSTVFQGLIIGAIVLAGFLVGLNTYLDCDFPKASTCWSDRFGQVLQAKRPCVSDNQAGADGLEASSWADEVWDNERGIYATTEVICHAQGCCFDGTKSTTRNETNCWKREAFPECFSGAGIDHASQAIQIIDQVILYLFTLECVLTIISHGKPFWRYFKNPWNMFDFVVVVLCYVDIGGNPAVLRLLRLMRIIKLLKFVEELQLILMGLVAGIQSLGYIMILLVMVFYLFAIMAIMYFKGNDVLHFENLEVAMISLFRIATMEDWTDIMYINMIGCWNYGYIGGSYCYDEEFCDIASLCTDANSQGSGFFSVIFFCVFTLISGFVIMSLFIGVICDAMQVQTEEHRKEKLIIKQERTKIQVHAELEERKANGISVTSSIDHMAGALGSVGGGQQWAADEVAASVLSEGGDEPEVPAGNAYIRLSTLVAGFVDEKTFSGKAFANVTLTCIIVAAVLIGMQTYKSLQEHEIVGPGMEICDGTILAYFTVECVIKIIAEKDKPWVYFTNAWNVFDFVVVSACFLPFGGSAVAVLRLLRLLRLVKLFKSLTQLQVIMNGLLQGMVSIGYIGLLMMLMFYVFGIMGIQLFRINDPVHFGSLHLTFVTLFRCATFEDWTDVMYVAMYGCQIYSYGYFTHRCENNEAWGLWSPLYFITFIVFSALIMLNLVIGSICGAMDDAQEDANWEKEQDAAIQRVVEDTTASGAPYRIPGVEEETIRRWMKGFQRMDGSTNAMDKEASIAKEDLNLVLELLGEKRLLTTKRRQHLLMRANHTLPIGWIACEDFIQALADDLLDARIRALRQTTGYVVVEKAVGLDTDQDFFSDTIDPFCVLYLNDKMIGKTQKLSHSGPDPTWDEYVAFPASYMNPDEPNKIRLDVFDFDTFTSDDLLGSIDIADTPGKPFTDRTITLPLQPKTSKPKNAVQGSIVFHIILPTKMPATRKVVRAVRAAAGLLRQQEGARDDDGPSGEVAPETGDTFEVEERVASPPKSQDDSEVADEKNRTPSLIVGWDRH